MELKFYFYVAYFFIALFVLYLFRVFNWNMIRTFWNDAKQNVANKEQIDKAVAKGEKPFYYENGKVVIYAKSQLGSMLKYKQSQLRHSVKARRTHNLKKV